MEIPTRSTEDEHKPETGSFEYSDPPSEILGEPERVAELWPELYETTSFSKQIERHHSVSQNINVVLDKLPVNMSIEDANTRGVISSAETINFYRSLGSVIGSDDSRNLILYLPFEFIPSTEWKTGNHKLNQTIGDFRDVFIQNWEKLLTVLSVRANFVDGDIIETAVRKTDHPRVVKAAHLIPELLKKGMIDKKMVLELMEKGSPVLKKSVNDVLPIILDWGLIDQDEFDRFSFVDNSGDGSLGETVTIERKKWLVQRQSEGNVLAQAKEICNKVLSETPLIKPGDEEIIVEGIKMAVETSYGKDAGKARQIFDKHKDLLFSLWISSGGDVKKRLTVTWRHFYQLGLIDKNQIEQLGVNLPNLSGHFSENLFLLSPENEKLSGIITDIRKDEVLREIVLPVILVGGSKVKGYGEPDSDTDVSMFIKPGVPESNKNLIRERIKEMFKKHDFQEIPVEFWLSQVKGGLGVRDLLVKDHWTGEDYWLYTLMDSFWFGEKREVEKLMTQILPPYFYESDKVKLGHEIRELYFEGIEKDLLQYRLMHKGYERSFPVLENPYKDRNSVGGASAFWDSGYRRTAMRLFVNNIFLPKLK